MNVNVNLQAMVAQRALGNNEKRLQEATAKLSSGYKINHARDDAAGLAISRKMRTQIRGLDQAGQNTKTGISVCETADGALAEVQDMLQRMNELAIKAANGTNTDEDRDAIQTEVAQLKKEITRISTQTEFNGNTLLDGTYDLKGYSSVKGVEVGTYTEDMPIGKYVINISSVGDETAVPPTNAVASLVSADGAEGASKFASKATVTAEGNTLTITDNAGKSMTVYIDPEKYAGAGDIELDITGIGAFSVQVGANEGQLLDMQIPEVSLRTLGIDKLDVSSELGAKEAIPMVKDALDQLSKVRAQLGAYQNRLEHTVASLDVTEENMTGAMSGIMDLDMSEEMVEYSTLQVLTQAGTSMLSQANSQPEQALQLIQ